jgi:hypothetical protein
MSNGPLLEIKQHRAFEIGKLAINKNLLKGFEGDVESVDHVVRFGVDLEDP